MIAVIADLARGGQTRIVVAHAMGFARRVAQTVHVMHEGRVAEHGSAEQVFDAPATYGGYFGAMQLLVLGRITQSRRHWTGTPIWRSLGASAGH